MTGTLPFRTPLTLREILGYVTREQDRDEPYAIYGSDDEASDELLMDATYVVDALPTVTEDEEEIYPAYAEREGLILVCSDEMVQDVVDLAMDQSDGKAPAAFLVQALNYYDENDEFLDFRRTS